MGDYTAVILDSKEQDSSCYMFVVQPKEDGGDDANAAWEGNLSLIKKTMEKGILGLKKDLEKKINSIQAQNAETKARDAYFDKETRSQYQRIMDRFELVEKRFDENLVEKTEDLNKVMNDTRRKTNDGLTNL